MKSESHFSYSFLKGVPQQLHLFFKKKLQLVSVTSSQQFWLKASFALVSTFYLTVNAVCGPAGKLFGM